MKTERLQQYEDLGLLDRSFVCKATYIKNGYTNINKTDSCALLTDIKIVNNEYPIIDHLWIINTKRIKATKVWKKEQHKTVYFIARFIKIIKPNSLYEVKEDLNLKIVKVIK